MKTANIYGLADPRSLEIKYVGRTIQPLALRLQHHIDFARKRKSMCARAAWILSLLTQGLKPEIFLLEEVALDAATESEGAWIQYFRYIGAELLNEQSHKVGGTRSHIIDWTPERLAKLGKVSDTELAEELGIDRKSVEYKRKTLSIPRKPQTNFVVPPMGGWNRIALPDHIIARLGTVSDQNLAREIGVSKKVIALARRARNIPDWSSQHNHPTQYKQGHRPTRWDKGKG